MFYDRFFKSNPEPKGSFDGIKVGTPSMSINMEDTKCLAAEDDPIHSFSGNDRAEHPFNSATCAKATEHKCGPSCRSFGCDVQTQAEDAKSSVRNQDEDRKNKVAFSVACAYAQGVLDGASEVEHTKYNAEKIANKIDNMYDDLKEIRDRARSVIKNETGLAVEVAKFILYPGGKAQ